MKNYRFDVKKSFGIGQGKGDLFWHSLLRQALLTNYLRKDIEQYGLIKLTDQGEEFLANGGKFSMSLNHDYSTEANNELISGLNNASAAALDETLVSMLKDLRLKEAKRHGVKPWILFLDPSLQDMATYYPTSIDDMLNISGVSKGKAERYGAPFIELIADYVEENEIERPDDFVVKQVANKSKSKVSIIQGVDRKLPLEDIAKGIEMSMEELLEEMNMIVFSGTKLDINYYLEDNMDEDVIEEICDYFADADSESIEEAFKELKDEDITEEEIKLVRLKFLSEMSN
jgi:ATP-dependent DNA helicase RecQ